MNYQQVKNFLITNYQQEKPLVAFIEGSPGVGKSACVYDATETLAKKFKEEGFGIKECRLSLLDPTDLRGTMWVDMQDKITRWSPPEMLPNGHDPKRGFFYLDELNTAPPLVQNAALQLMFFPYKLGEYQLQYPKWLPVSAGNPQGEAYVYSFSPALANRMVQITLNPELDEWIGWATKVGINPEIISFLLFRRDLFLQVDKSGKPFPSPRAHEFVDRAEKAQMNTEVLVGIEGEGWVLEYMAYKEVYKSLPDMDKILKGENIVPSEPSVLFAVVGNLLSKAHEDNKLVDRIVSYSLSLPAEFSVVLMKGLLGAFPAVVWKAPAWKEWKEQYKEVTLWSSNSQT